jgi:hypothetical protein
MKKQILSEEFRRMQILAGIITEEIINVEKGYTPVDFDAYNPHFGLNSKWHKQNLPFEFKSPLSGKEYKILHGRVKSVRSYGKVTLSLVLYTGGISSDLSIKINDIYKDDDIVTIEEGSDKKNLYIKNLPEKDILYKIIKDIKLEIED